MIEILKTINNGVAYAKIILPHYEEINEHLVRTNGQDGITVEDAIGVIQRNVGEIPIRNSKIELNRYGSC